MQISVPIAPISIFLTNRPAWTEYYQLIGGFENSHLEESIFNNSMFLIVFSYFEGVINTIVIEEKIVILNKNGKPKKMPSADEILSQIEKIKGVTFSTNYKQSLKCIQLLRELRNYITHNNGALGSKKEMDVIRLIRKIKGVDIYKGTVVICDLSFVQTTLDKIYSILKELSIVLNYGSKQS